MQNFPNLKNPLHFIATLGGLGKIPIAPGTFGSIFAWFIFIFLSHYINMIFLTFAVGIFSVWICEKITKNLYPSECILGKILSSIIISFDNFYVNMYIKARISIT